jgi:hypothetical protein
VTVPPVASMSERWVRPAASLVIRDGEENARQYAPSKTPTVAGLTISVPYMLCQSITPGTFHEPHYCQLRAGANQESQPPDHLAPGVMRFN